MDDYLRPAPPDVLRVDEKDLRDAGARVPAVVRPAMNEIVKVQVTVQQIGYPHRGLNALVYARGHCDLRLQDLDQATLDALGDDAKGYYDGELVDGRFWRLGKRVEDQPW